jgi:hypothetical protein
LAGSPSIAISPPAPDTTADHHRTNVDSSASRPVNHGSHSELNVSSSGRRRFAG